MAAIAVIDANDDYLGMVRPVKGGWRAVDDRGLPVVDEDDTGTRTREVWPTRRAAVDALCDVVDVGRNLIEYPIRLEES